MKKANSFGIFKTFLFFLPTLQLKKLWLKTLMSNLIRFLLLTILFVSVYGVHKKKIVKNNANIWICMGHAFFAVWFFLTIFSLQTQQIEFFLKLTYTRFHFSQTFPLMSYLKYESELWRPCFLVGVRGENEILR